MRFRLIAATVLICGSLFVQGQQNHNMHSQDYFFSLSTNPAFVPVRSMNSGISFGAEMRFSEHIALLLDNTFYTGPRDNSDRSAVGKKYYRFKPELRYYFNDRGTRPLFYAGIQGGFATRSWTNERGGYYFSGNISRDSAEVYDRAHLKSPVTTLSAQGGVLFYISEKFSLDYFIGFGWRQINTTYSDQVNLHREQRSFPKDGFSIKSAFQYEGIQTMTHVNVGLRLFYHFVKAAKPAPARPE